MIDVKGTTISMTRSDTLMVKIGIKNKATGEEYIPVAGDRIRFAMNTDFKYQEPVTPLILKEIPIDTMMLVLEPDDTKDLEYGTYKYDIELTTEDGIVDTFITEASFKLMKEVY